MKKLLYYFLFIAVLVPTTFIHAEEVCIKTGRQYYIELANYLGLKSKLSDYKVKFLEVASNLPKKGFSSEFAPSLSSLIQLSDSICTDYAENEEQLLTYDQRIRSKSGDIFIIERALQKILRRPAKTEQVEAILGLGAQSQKQLAYLSCLMASASIDFIKNGKCK